MAQSYEVVHRVPHSSRLLIVSRSYVDTEEASVLASIESHKNGTIEALAPEPASTRRQANRASAVPGS